MFNHYKGLLVLMFVIAVMTPALAPAAPGDLDSQFSGDGKVYYDFFGLDDNVHGLAQQKDGKIVACGYSYDSSNGGFFLTVFRLHLDGSLDQSFGTGGVVVSTLARSARAVKIQDDGSIVVAGYGYAGNFAVVRMDSFGVIDSGFGDAGLADTQFGGNESANDLVILKDGSIVAAGSKTNTNEILLAKYTADGQPDSSFGDLGIMEHAYEPFTEITVRAVAVLSDGKILVGGGAKNANGDTIFMLARFTSTGFPDFGFGDDGIITTAIQGNFDVIEDLKVYPSGQILAGGTSKDDGSQGNYALVRYSANGVVEAAKSADINVDGSAAAMDIRADGKIIVAGGWGTNFGIEQFTPSLEFDGSFKSTGVVNIDFEGNDDRGYAALIQQDGKILIAGAAKSGVGPTNNYAFARVKGFSSPLLADDFENSQLSWIVGSGPWTETNGELSVSTVSTAKIQAPSSWLPSGDSGCNECSILFQLTTPGGPLSKVNVYAWSSGGNFVQLVISPEKGKFVLKQKYGGVLSKKTAKVTMLPNTPYFIELSNDGENIRLTVDRTLVAEMPVQGFLSGNISLKVKNTSVAFEGFNAYTVD